MAEYIERDAVIRDLEEAEKHKGMGMVVAQTLKQYVKRVPAADVAPVVHAKWVFNGICTSCSACGSNKPTKAHDHKLASREVRFCYFCGAKMDLEESK